MALWGARRGQKPAPEGGDGPEPLRRVRDEPGLVPGARDEPGLMPGARDGGWLGGRGGRGASGATPDFFGFWREEKALSREEVGGKQKNLGAGDRK